MEKSLRDLNLLVVLMNTLKLTMFSGTKDAMIEVNIGNTELPTSRANLS